MTIKVFSLSPQSANQLSRSVLEFLGAVVGSCLVASVAGSSVSAHELELREMFSVGHRYETTTSLSIQGRIALPPTEKGKSPQIIDMTGRSRIRYDEVVLPSLDSSPWRTLRAYREFDMHRVQAGQAFTLGLRPSVRRCVFLWNSPHRKLFFSPDGALTWEETDLLRTDVFIPAVVQGLLPRNAVRLHQSWRMAPEAIAELVDIEKVESGELLVTLQAVTSLNDRRVARLGIAGQVRGVNEDGPTRQTFDGSTAYFDLDARMLTYLSLRAVKEMLDGQGQVVGRTEGHFTVARAALPSVPNDLTEDACRHIELKPTFENTLLLYENPRLGLRLLHPRSWRLNAEQGRQVTFDHPRAAGGLLLTVESPRSTPTPQDYLKEITDYLQQVKARDTRLIAAPARIRNDPPIDRFELEAVLNNTRCRLLYAVIRQPEGGVTVAVRVPADYAVPLAPEIERIVRSIALTKNIPEK